MFSVLWLRVRAVFRRKSVETELDEELGSHLERQVGTRAECDFSKRCFRTRATACACCANLLGSPRWRWLLWPWPSEPTPLFFLRFTRFCSNRCRLRIQTGSSSSKRKIRRAAGLGTLFRRRRFSRGGSRAALSKTWRHTR